MMLDLYNQKYSREELKRNIYSVKVTDILKTQILDRTFVVRYILNRKYQLLQEETEITLEMVLKYQPHLHKNDILTEISLYTSDDDSVENFDMFSK